MVIQRFHVGTDNPGQIIAVAQVTRPTDITDYLISECYKVKKQDGS